MITFSCQCNYRFDAPDDEAGGLIQCPQCGRLNDVPLLADAPNLNPDGTYRLDETPVEADPQRLRELSYVYTKGRVDTEGNEIDLRLKLDDIRRTGTDKGDAAPAPPEREKPRYDPITGELIRPLAVKDDLPAMPPQAEIPMAKVVVSYNAIPRQRRGSSFRPFLSLLTAPNVAVMAFILVFHLALLLMMVVLLSGVFIIVAGPFILFIGLLAHYSNTIDEVGREERDELPRPLRSLSWTEDIWGPFTHLALAAAISFGPGLAMLFGGLAAPARFHLALASCLLLGGMLIFPALLLTNALSGSVLNLRPDRVLQVIRICGGAYWVSVLTLLLTVILYFLGMTSLGMSVAWLFMPLTAAGTPPWIRLAMVGIGLLTLGIYTMHAMCWQLGLLYREHRDSFPWVLQRFIPDPTRKRVMQYSRDGVPLGVKETPETQPPTTS